MSAFQEIWKWDDAQKRLEEAREYRTETEREAIARLEREVRELRRDIETLRGLYNAKQLAMARLQKRVEELEKAK